MICWATLASNSSTHFPTSCLSVCLEGRKYYILRSQQSDTHGPNLPETLWVSQSVCQSVYLLVSGFVSPVVFWSVSQSVREAARVLLRPSVTQLPVGHSVELSDDPFSKVSVVQNLRCKLVTCDTHPHKLFHETSSRQEGNKFSKLIVIKYEVIHCVIIWEKETE
jgi:hypothetical protein